MRFEHWFHLGYCFWHALQQPQVVSLRRYDCEVVSTLPNKRNIYYEVCPHTTVEVDLQHVLKSLMLQKNLAHRMTVYCNSLDTYTKTSMRTFMMNLVMHPTTLWVLRGQGQLPVWDASCQHSPPQQGCHTQEFHESRGNSVGSFFYRCPGGGWTSKMSTTLCTMEHQESGRCGQSGANARSVVFWKPSKCPCETHLLDMTLNYLLSESMYRTPQCVVISGYQSNLIPNVCCQPWTLVYVVMSAQDSYGTPNLPICVLQYM